MGRGTAGQGLPLRGRLAGHKRINDTTQLDRLARRPLAAAAGLQVEAMQLLSNPLTSGHLGSERALERPAQVALGSGLGGKRHCVVLLYQMRAYISGRL